MSQNKNPALKRAIKRAGGPSELARKIREQFSEKITAQAICGWTKCPPRRVLQVEAVTGESRHLLRSDLYPQQ